MIQQKIKPKIIKVIKKFPTKVIIKRDSQNEFGEPHIPIVICDIEGFWHDGNTMISQIITNGGEIKREKQNFLMVVYDRLSCLINEGDYFILDGSKYEIADKGNKNKMNIYFDMLVKRC